MASTIFAAIDLGSFEIAIKIFEISNRGVKELDHVRHRIELGTDTYNTGKISLEKMDELCDILNKFKTIMDTYKVDDYRACATSAIRESENTRIVLDQIKLRTGLTVRVVSNSEQRFLNYKSVALEDSRFDQVINSGSAFLDIGGGSTQVSLFSDAKLIATYNMNLGILRIRENLAALQPKTDHYEQLIEEIVDNELHIFRKLYLKDIDIKNIIVVDDYISYIFNKIGSGIDINMVTGKQFVTLVDELKEKSPEQLAKTIGLPPENSTLLLPSAIMIKHFVESTGAEVIWMPGVSLSDGIAYDYAQQKKYIKGGHDFEKDIISGAQAISQRYRGSKSRGNTLTQVSLAIFDAMKKIHGLSSRDRILLQLSAILRDCGKFISPQAAGECAYNIVMHTEIIGISHKEREMVAQTIKNSYAKFLYYDELVNVAELDEEAYLVVAKLTAMLQVASGLALSKKKPLDGVKATVSGNQLIITLDSTRDFFLEKGLFGTRTAFFEEVFGIKPSIKMKKGTGLSHGKN